MNRGKSHYLHRDVGERGERQTNDPISGDEERLSQGKKNTTSLNGERSAVPANSK